MPTITKKSIEEIVEKRINKKVEYIGILVNNEYIRIRPRKFGFWKLDSEGGMDGFIIVSERDVARLLKEKEEAEKEKELIQSKLL